MFTYYYYSPKRAVPSSGWLRRVANQSAEKERETVDCCTCGGGSARSLSDLALTLIGRCGRLAMRHLLSREFVLKATLFHLLPHATTTLLMRQLA